jgi:hypothetical protein
VIRKQTVAATRGNGRDAPKAHDAWRCTSDGSTASELNRYVGVTEIALLGEEKLGGISDLAPTQWKGALNRSRQRRHGSATRWRQSAMR